MTREFRRDVHDAVRLSPRLCGWGTDCGEAQQYLSHCRRSSETEFVKPWKYGVRRDHVSFRRFSVLFKPNRARNIGPERGSNI